MKLRLAMGFVMAEISHEKRNRLGKAGPAFDNFRDDDPWVKPASRKRRNKRDIHDTCVEELKREKHNLQLLKIKFEEFRVLLFEEYIESGIECKHSLPIMQCGYQCKNDENEGFELLTIKLQVVKESLIKAISRIEKLEYTIKKTRKFSNYS